MMNILSLNGKFFLQYSSTSIDQQKSRPIQQASFAPVTHSATMMATITPNRKTPSEDILQTTLKQSSNHFFFYSLQTFIHS